jgi:hypothetical protein
MFLFENTFYVSVLGFLLVSVLLARRLITGEPAHNKILGVATIATLVLVAASWMIVTPRERIVATCRDLAHLVDEGNIAEIGTRLAPGFTAGGIHREEFLDRAAATLTHTRLDQIRLWSVIVEMETNGRAVATFNATCNIRTAEEFATALPSRWRLRFTQHGEQWQLKEVETIPVPPLNWKTLPFRP